MRSYKIFYSKYSFRGKNIDDIVLKNNSLKFLDKKRG